MIVTWVGTINFRDSRRWLQPITVKAEATTHNGAVTRALRMAKKRLPPRFQVKQFTINLTRVATEPGHDEQTQTSSN